MGGTGEISSSLFGGIRSFIEELVYMSWYKTSKLIDKKGPTDIASMHSACAYCERWATHDDTGSQETSWKFYDQLSREDKAFVDASKREGIRDRHVSHGICPTCWSSMEFLNDKEVDAFSLPHIFYKKLAAADQDGKARILEEIIKGYQNN